MRIQGFILFGCLVSASMYGAAGSDAGDLCEMQTTSLERALAKGNEKNALFLASMLRMNIERSLVYAAKQSYLQVLKYLLETQQCPFSSSLYYFLLRQEIVTEHSDQRVGLLKKLLAPYTFNYTDVGKHRMGWKAIHSAVIEKDIEMIKLLKLCNISFDETITMGNLKGSNALHLAILQQDDSESVSMYDMVNLLLDAGCDINMQDVNGNTPLLLATSIDYHDKKRVIDLLLERRADCTICNYKGTSSLYQAASCGDTDLFKKLLRHGARIAIINDPSSPCHLWGLLHTAAHNGHTDMVRYMLEHCAQDIDVNAKTARGYAPLHLAFLKNRNHNNMDEMISLLLNHGASLEIHSKIIGTPLALAACYGHTEYMRLLLQKGASVHPPQTNARSPLFCAVIQNHEDAVKLLLQQPDIQVEVGFGVYTPFLAGCYKGASHNIIEMLMAAGAQTRQQLNGLNAMHHIAQNNGKHLLSLLISSGLSVQDKGPMGKTPLHIACESGHLDMVAELIENGAQINERDDAGRTPLFFAAQHGHASIVKLLLTFGADRTIKDNFSMKAIDIAREMNHEEVISLLTLSKSQKKAQKKKREKAQFRYNEKAINEQNRYNKEQKKQKNAYKVADDHEAVSCSLQEQKDPKIQHSEHKMPASSSIQKESEQWVTVANPGKLFHTATVFGNNDCVILRQYGDHDYENMSLVIYKKDNVHEWEQPMILLEQNYLEKNDKFHRFSPTVDNYISYGTVVDDGNEESYKDLLDDHKVHIPKDSYVVMLPGKIAPRYYNYRDALSNHDVITHGVYSGCFVYIFDQNGTCRHRCFHQNKRSRSVNNNFYDR